MRLRCSIRPACACSRLSPGRSPTSRRNSPPRVPASTRWKNSARSASACGTWNGNSIIAIHLMSAGRLQLYDKRAGPRDRTSRLLVRVRTGEGERELRLREFGSKQAAWVKLLRAGEYEQDEALSKLGPEAWPETPALEG